MATRTTHNLPTAEYKHRLDLGFELLQELAAQGKRCPFSTGPFEAFPNYIVSGLIKEGRIRSEISGKNWRQIIIMVGPHAGKKTMANPDKAANVWMTMDASGTKRHGHFIDVGQSKRRRPSAPRPLTETELE